MFNKPFRSHFSSVIEATLRTSWVIIVILITNFIGILQEVETGGSEEAFFGAVALLGILLFIFIISCIRWAKTYIELQNDTIVIEKRLLMSNKTTIAIKTISTVNLEQNLLQRIFGTYKLKLDTNSSVAPNNTDAKIILKKSDAIELKRIITNKINNNEIEDIEENKYDIEYDFDKVVMHSILNTPVFAIIYAIFIFVVSGITFQQDISEVSNSIQRYITIIIMIIPAVFSLITGIFKLYGFKVKRYKDKVYIKYGLITRNEYAIPIEKINAIVVRQPVLARIFKKYTVELINIGMGEEKNESPVMLIMGNKNEIIENIKKILPEITLTEETQKQPKKAIIPIAIKVTIIAMIFILPAIIFLPYSTISILGFALLSGILMYTTREIGIYDKYIKIVNGIFSRKFTLIKYEKIQYIQIQKSILTERIGIEKANIYILAQLAKVKHYTGYFNVGEFQKISDKLIKTNSKV